MNQAALRAEMVMFARSLFQRGFSVGSAGNISAAIEDGLLITPTNACLGFLDPDRISKLDKTGRHVGGDPPSKELHLHRAFYETRAGVGAVVHLHSTYATAVSCLEGVDPADCLPPLVPYAVMRVGRVRLLPYRRPGDPALGELIRELKGEHAAVLLANHGPVVSAVDLRSAVFASEELEEAAKLRILLQGEKTVLLTEPQISDLHRHFGQPAPGKSDTA